MFWCKEFWIITLIILLIVDILGKSKHLIHAVKSVSWEKTSSETSEQFVMREAKLCTRDSKV